MNLLEQLFFDIVDVGNIIIVVLSFFPMILNIKYYRKTGLLDYLLVSIYFFGWAILVGFGMIYLGMIPFLEWDGLAGDFVIIDLIYGNIIFYYTLVFDAFPLFVVAIRAKYGGSFKNIPNLVKGLGILSILLGLLAIIDQNQIIINPNVPGADFLRVVLYFNRAFFHFFVVYAFISCNYQETPRSKLSRKIWIIASATWVFSMAYGAILAFVLAIPDTPLTFAIFVIPIDIGFALLLINHIFYPESVLFTHEQLGRALKAYPIVEEATKENPDWGINRIKWYLDSIPEDVKKEVIRTQSNRKALKLHGNQ
ncbi:MAG: hypothetical protein ACXADY_10495 [Candidatus Hodarchaeales archaeon]|jgi:hypothetical protein